MVNCHVDPNYAMGLCRYIWILLFGGPAWFTPALAAGFSLRLLL